jgi:hypothetical protein
MDPKPLYLKYYVVKNLFANESYCNSAESLVQWVNDKIIKRKAEPETFISNFDTDHIDNLRVLSFIDKFNMETLIYNSDDH